MDTYVYQTSKFNNLTTAFMIFMTYVYDNPQMETTPDYCKLLVEKSRREDSGPYTITAENAHGKDSATIDVSRVFITFPLFCTLLWPS